MWLLSFANIWGRRGEDIPLSLDSHPSHVLYHVCGSLSISFSCSFFCCFYYQGPEMLSIWDQCPPFLQLSSPLASQESTVTRPRGAKRSCLTNRNKPAVHSVDSASTVLQAASHTPGVKTEVQSRPSTCCKESCLLLSYRRVMWVKSVQTTEG